MPDGFVFAVKASRSSTDRKVLAEAGESIERFVGQAGVELGDRFGPILWPFMATRRFDPDDMAAFLALSPSSHAGVPLRHAVQVWHESFPDRAQAARTWAAGGQPEGLPYVAANAPARAPRDTFVFFINGAKARAPHGAMAPIARVRG